MNFATINPMPVVELVPLDGSTTESAGRTTASAESFEQAIAQHHAVIRKLVQRLLGWTSDAEDVLQDSYLKAWRSWGRFRGECHVRTWLARIAINQCRSHHRRKMLGLGLLARLWGGPTPREAPAADLPAEQRDRAAQIRLAVNALRPRDREVIVLHYLEEMSIADVATLLQTTRGAVEVRLSRARNRLRAVLENRPTDE
jgi:RNA polymerase sigma-70 factor (ECF subfamily)